LRGRETCQPAGCRVSWSAASASSARGAADSADRTGVVVLPAIRPNSNAVRLICSPVARFLDSSENAVNHRSVRVRRDTIGGTGCPSAAQRGQPRRAEIREAPAKARHRAVLPRAAAEQAFTSTAHTNITMAAATNGITVFPNTILYSAPPRAQRRVPISTLLPAPNAFSRRQNMNSTPHYTCRLNIVKRKSRENLRGISWRAGATSHACPIRIKRITFFHVANDTPACAIGGQPPRCGASTTAARCWLGAGEPAPLPRLRSSALAAQQSLRLGSANNGSA